MTYHYIFTKNLVQNLKVQGSNPNKGKNFITFDNAAAPGRIFFIFVLMLVDVMFPPASPLDSPEFGFWFLLFLLAFPFPFFWLLPVVVTAFPVLRFNPDPLPVLFKPDLFSFLPTFFLSLSLSLSESEFESESELELDEVLESSFLDCCFFFFRFFLLLEFGPLLK